MCVLANVVTVSNVIYLATTHIANSGYSIISGSLLVTVLKRKTFTAYLYRSSTFPDATQICSTNNQNFICLVLFMCRIEVQWTLLAERFALFENSRPLNGMLIHSRPVRFLEHLLCLLNVMLKSHFFFM